MRKAKVVKFVEHRVICSKCKKDFQVSNTHWTTCPDCRPIDFTPKPLSGLHIEGRRWFQRTYGNTYHSVRIFANGECLTSIGETYGYGDHYLQTALDWLAVNGYIPLREGSKFSAAHYGTRYLREELQGTYSVVDVERKREL